MAARALSLAAVAAAPVRATPAKNFRLLTCERVSSEPEFFRAIVSPFFIVAARAAMKCVEPGGGLEQNVTPSGGDTDARALP
jgi:hypothetical protein